MSNYRLPSHQSKVLGQMTEVWRDKGVGIEEKGWGVKVHVEDGLFNPVTTQRLYIREKPWHRVVAELAAAGHTHAEICAFTGRSRRAVQIVLAQPYAQERVAKKAAMNASEEIREILEKAAPESLRRIMKLAEDGSEAEDIEERKLAAAMDQSILDRFMGKPNQPISTAVTTPAQQLTDEELDKRIAQSLPDLVVGRNGTPSPEEHS